MNAISVFAQGTSAEVMTMSSLEIAELVESRHDNVKRTIERISDKGVIQLPPLAEVENKQSLSPNKWTKVYNLCKRDSLVVVAQLCPEFTGKLVDRWQELEAAAAQPTLPPVNLTRMQLIELARDAEGERLVLESKVDQLKTTMTRFVQQFEEILQTEGTLASKGFQAFRETQASLASNPLSPQPKLSTFEFEGRTVRVVTDATGETRFVGKDVCQVLGFRQHSRVIHESCRGEMKYHHFPAGRGKQPHRLLSEADVFLLVDKSVSPSANTFWQHLQDEFLGLVQQPDRRWGVAKQGLV